MVDKAEITPLILMGRVCAVVRAMAHSLLGVKITPGKSGELTTDSLQRHCLAIAAIHFHGEFRTPRRSDFHCASQVTPHFTTGFPKDF